MAAEKLRDLSQLIDVPLLDTIVAAFYSTRSKEELSTMAPPRGRGGSGGGFRAKGDRRRGRGGGGRGGGGDRGTPFKARGGGRGGGGRGGHGGRGGMKGGSRVVVEPHRHEGIFITKGKEDALVTKNLVPGEAVYNEKRITVQEGLAPINLIVENDLHRATPGGTGGVKTIGNYAAVLKAHSAAKAKGYSDVLYLDCVHKRYSEEVSSCNIFVVKGNIISTPSVKGTILPGVT